MPRIKIESVKEGMAVGSDVKNIDSMLLVPAGCTLSERQINILNAWGVTDVDVVLAEGDEADDPLAKFSPEELEKMATEIKERFWQVDETNPVFMEIFKLALERRLQAGIEEPAPV